MRIIIATMKSWNIARAQALQKKYKGVHEICIYTKREEFTAENVCDFQPDYIFCHIGLILCHVRLRIIGNVWYFI